MVGEVGERKGRETQEEVVVSAVHGPVGQQVV